MYSCSGFLDLAKIADSSRYFNEAGSVIPGRTARIRQTRGSGMFGGSGRCVLYRSLAIGPQ